MACMNACPKNAIESEIDEKGFIYPKINLDKCIHCNLCERVCDWQGEVEKKQRNKIERVFSLQIKDKKALWQSASGGAFSAIATYVIDNGGCVFGAAWNHLNLQHIMVDSISNLDEIRGTKYLQSSINLIYRNVKSLLEVGKLVLFVGTPCQVAGLKSYLRKDYEKLLLVDFICHGVPSNNFFKEHINYLEKIYNKEISKYYFRIKKYSWNSSGIEGVRFVDGKESFGISCQAYNSFFYSNLSLRPSCYHCIYRTTDRVSDITISDFWNAKSILKKVDNRGLSLVYFNSKKSTKLIKEIQSESILNEIDVDKVLYRFKADLKYNPDSVDTFWKDYIKLGYEGLVKKNYIKKLTFTKKARFIVKKIYRRYIK